MPRQSEATLSAIKNAVDLVALVGESMTLHRSGAKYKALCPFHDDHTPSLELNPDRQSYKCWSCGAGGDIFDFVQNYERVDFPEALRMLADRAGISLEDSGTATAAAPGLSKSELLEVTAWAERVFADSLARSPEALDYLKSRGLTRESAEKFHLGYAPEARDWMTARAKKDGIGAAALERVGLIVRSEDRPIPRERFRGRLIFPIRDIRGRALGFGGRILPSIEKTWADSGRKVAKYLNSPETPLFQKRRVLYGADVARPAARAEGWVAVVEGYTDVIAAHQVGFSNVVGTLGTALGDDHVAALRRMADRAVLVFDGDEAGQKAADRSLELFLGHEVDVRVLTLPEEFDPCDFLLKHGADAFRSMVEGAVDPLAYAIGRASARFDFASPEGSRQAAEWVLGALAKIPDRIGAGLDVKVAKALDTLSRKLSVPVVDLRRRLHELRRPARVHRAADAVVPSETHAAVAPAPIRLSDLDKTDRQLIQVLLNEPTLVGRLITRVMASSLQDAPLRALLQVCYDLHGSGVVPTFDRITARIDDPALRSLAAGLLVPIGDPNTKMLDVSRPASAEIQLSGLLARYEERDRQAKLRDLQLALAETDPAEDPEGYKALMRESLRLSYQRPVTKRNTAS
ncbi:DNA primase [Tundrisphaera sp. TA3]|uniref:DNA primase n=1 Tax=Tundrisphaera sp. TA3 TaxID=3435775 RepID=UPI003EBF1233